MLLVYSPVNKITKYSMCTGRTEEIWIYRHNLAYCPLAVLHQ